MRCWVCGGGSGGDVPGEMVNQPEEGAANHSDAHLTGDVQTAAQV